jgi:hypothetical protein
VPGDYVCVARKSGEMWFTGAVSDENCRLVKIPLSFLDKGKDYVAEIYCDDISTNWETNPNKVEIASYKVNSSDTIYAAIAKAGGNSVILRPANAEDKNLVGIYVNNKKAKEK